MSGWRSWFRSRRPASVISPCCGQPDESTATPRGLYWGSDRFDRVTPSPSTVRRVACRHRLPAPELARVLPQAACGATGAGAAAGLADPPKAN